MTRITGQLVLKRDGFVLDTAFDSAGPGVTALCGPSGAGKTSLLRCLAGLETPDAGTLSVGGETWFDADSGRSVPPQLRSIGYVTQEPSLFAHLSVEDNLLYGFKRLPESARRTSLAEVVDGLGLQTLRSRRVTNLSGGERQRVAIGRALLRSPQVLLLDEPVSALDVSSRADVLRYLRQVLERFAVRCVYVSHDLREAARLAHEMLWMDRGRVVAQGVARDVLTDVRLPFADLDEAESLLDGVIEGHDEAMGLTRIRCADSTLWLTQVAAPVGSKHRVQIAARDVSLALSAPGDVSVLNVLEGTVVELVPASRQPGQMIVRLDVAGHPLLARITRKSALALQLQPGTRVWALVKGVALAE
jgi:molybdate transport system ATP-binding protein